MKNIFALLSLIAILGCASEKPIAIFEYEKKEDGTIVFINNSQNAISYQWDFGDGSFDSSKSPTHKFEKNGKYNVKLISTDKTGDQGSSIVTIEIDNVEFAKYVFWTKNKKYIDIEIFIDGVHSGNIDKAFSSTPDCGTYGAVTVELPAGKYKMSAKGSNGSKWSGMYLNFEKGRCLKLELE